MLRVCRHHRRSHPSRSPAVRPAKKLAAISATSIASRLNSPAQSAKILRGMRHFSRLLLLAALGALGAAALASAPSLGDLALLVALLAVFVAPGWPLSRWVAGSAADPITRGLLTGLLGYASGATVYALLRAANVSSPFGVLAACAALALALHLRVPRQAAGLLKLAHLERSDHVGLAIL